MKKEIKVNGKALSGNEIRRRFANQTKLIEQYEKKKKDDFNVIYALAINLFYVNPENKIFHNKTFNDEFLSTIEKIVKDKKEKEAAKIKDSESRPSAVESIAVKSLPTENSEEKDETRFNEEKTENQENQEKN